MSQVKIKIGCCDRPTPSSNTIICQSCKYKYHLNCVNINKSLKDLTEEFKLKWICPCCRSKLPKSDNSNTPIRGSYQQTVDSDEINVNTRRGGQNEKIDYMQDAPIDVIRQVVREELEYILHSFKINILNQFELKTKELLDSIKSVSTSVSTIEKQQDIIKKELESNVSKISHLESENISLRSTVSELNSRIARMEQHSRASNVEIQNIPEHKAENLISITKQVASIANYKLNDSDIHVCTRVAKINSDSQRPRSVVVKFNSPRVRDEFLAATLKFNKKATNVTDKLNTTHLGIGGSKKPIFVVEHLSPTQKAVHAAARIKAKELNYKFVWVNRSRVFMRKTETSDYKLIKSIQDLAQLE